jgi:hypothetical protein
MVIFAAKIDAFVRILVDLMERIYISNFLHARSNATPVILRKLLPDPHPISAMRATMVAAQGDSHEQD